MNQRLDIVEGLYRREGMSDKTQRAIRECLVYLGTKKRAMDAIESELAWVLEHKPELYLEEFKPE